MNILTLSPETTGIYLSQAGGEFGPDMKRAGFDAIVIKGKSSSPVYLKIKTEDDRCHCEFIHAEHLWGKDRVATANILRRELNEKFSMASIGPAGENLISWANIMFETDHYAGRGGIGAVMGSKHLKAICIKGDKKPEFKDRRSVMAINKTGAKRFREFDSSSFLKILRNVGTFGLLKLNEEGGNLPTRNFKYTCIETEKFQNEIDYSNAGEKYIGKSSACKACFIACKKKYKQGIPYSDYTAMAEYESIALLGPNLGLEDQMDECLQACELCNRLGLDTISTGNIIAWLMDCFENNIIDENKIGFSIHFGDGKKTCELIENIALRKTTIGDLLTDGVLKAEQEFGPAAKPFLRASRGMGLPAHMPRKKPGLGFGYLHGPNPADHMKLEHDWLASDQDSLDNLGLTIRSEPNALDENKVEIASVTQHYYSLVDTLSLCMFVFGPGNIYTYDEMAQMVNAATGFNFTFDELMALGKESIMLQRKLYYGLGGKDEEFLPYLEVPIPNGPAKGNKINRADFEKARAHYNELWK